MEHVDHAITMPKTRSTAQTLPMPIDYGAFLTRSSHDVAHEGSKRYSAFPSLKIPHFFQVGIDTLHKFHQTKHGRIILDLLALGAMVGLMVGASFIVPPFGTIFMAMLPNLFVGLWIAYRIPQKVDTDALGPSISRTQTLSDENDEHKI